MGGRELGCLDLATGGGLATGRREHLLAGMIITTLGVKIIGPPDALTRDRVHVDAADRDVAAHDAQTSPAVFEAKFDPTGDVDRGTHLPADGVAAVPDADVTHWGHHAKDAGSRRISA